MAKAEIIDGVTGEIVERVIAVGDLDKLTPLERTQYLKAVCDSIGVNPLTKPFEYIRLNGKLTLYALRGCTDQLRTVHGVSVEEMSETERDGVFIVTCKVRNAQGRTDMSKGAVPISGLKGEALANAIMKCETKAKRRATLSLCGLGLLDESELETIPASAIAIVPPEAPVVEVIPPQQSAEAAPAKAAPRRPAVEVELPVPPVASPVAPAAKEKAATSTAPSPIRSSTGEINKQQAWDNYTLMLKELSVVESEEQLNAILGSEDYGDLYQAVGQIRKSSQDRLNMAAKQARERLELADA